MKKNLIIFCLMIFFSININALKIKFVNDNFVTTLNWKIQRIYVDDKLSFCIQPGKVAGTTNYTKKDFQKQYASLSATKKNNIKKIGLVGESLLNEAKKSNNKNFHYYYYAAQELIWDQVNTKKYRFKINLTTYRNNINKQVTDFSKLSKHHNKTYTIKTGESKTYTDALLTDFTLKNKAAFEQQTGLKVTLSKDKLTFNNSTTNNKVTTSKLNLTKFKNKYSTGTSLVYINSTLQDFVKVNNDFNIDMNVSIKTALSQGKMEGYKVDDFQKPLGNAVFGYFQSNKQLGTMKSDNNGYFTSPLLMIGTYQVKEITAPLDYELNSTVYTVVIKDNATTKINNGNKIVNTLKKGRIKLHKYGEVFNNDDYKIKPLKDVKYGIYQDNKHIETITSDDNGEAVSNKLNPGKYIVKEIQTLKEYLLDAQEFVAEVKADETFVINNGKVIINYLKKGSFKMLKKDEDNSPIKDVVFGLYLNDGTLLEELISDNEGIISKTNLPFNQYYLKEHSTPNKYLLDTKQININIEKEELFELTDFINYYDNHKIIIKKVDSISNNKLLGAKFTIKSLNNEIIDTLEIVDNQLIVNNLKPECYLVEEILAPDGYTLNKDNKQKVCLNNSKNKEAIFKNSKIKQSILRIEKYDKDTNKPLENTEFIIKNGNKEIIEKTNENGYFELTLNKGCYIVSEKQATSGYINEYQSEQICLKEGERQTKRFYNRKMIKVKAGIKGTSTTIFYLLIASTITIALLKKKCTNKRQ